MEIRPQVSIKQPADDVIDKNPEADSNSVYRPGNSAGPTTSNQNHTEGSFYDSSHVNPFDSSQIKKAAADTNDGSQKEQTTEISPASTVNSSSALEDSWPPYEEEQIIHMISGHTFQVKEVKFLNNDVAITMQRVIIGEDGVINQEINTHEFPANYAEDRFEAGEEYPLYIESVFLFDGDTGLISGGFTSHKYGNFSFGGYRINPITKKILENSDRPTGIQELTKQENLLKDFQEIILRHGIGPAGGDRGIPEPHPDDIDIGPNGAPNAQWAGGGSGGGGGVPGDSGGIDGAGDFGNTESAGDYGYGDGSGEGRNGGWTPPPPPTKIPPAV